MEKNGFTSVIDYIGLAQETIDNLKAFQTVPEFRDAYQAAQSAKELITERLYREPVMMKAIDFVFFGG